MSESSGTRESWGKHARALLYVATTVFPHSNDFELHVRAVKCNSICKRVNNCSSLIYYGFSSTCSIKESVNFSCKGFEGGFSFRSLLDYVSGWAPIETMIGSPAAFENQGRRWMQRVGTGATTTILGLAAHLPNIFLQLALASIACFFLLVDGHRFLCWMTDKIPIAADVRVQVMQSFQDTAISVIWATLAAAAAQSAVMLLSYLTLGVPAAFLAAGATCISITPPKTE